MYYLTLSSRVRRLTNSTHVTAVPSMKMELFGFYSEVKIIIPVSAFKINISGGNHQMELMTGS